MKKNATETKTTTAKFNPNQPTMNRKAVRSHRSVLRLKQTPDQENKLPAIFHRTEHCCIQITPQNTQIGCECDKHTLENDSFSGVLEKSRLISIVNEPKISFRCSWMSIKQCSRIDFTVCSPWKCGASKECDKNSMHKHEANEQMRRMQTNSGKWHEMCNNSHAISVFSQMRNGQFSFGAQNANQHPIPKNANFRTLRKGNQVDKGFWHTIYGNFSSQRNSNGLLQLPMQLEWQLFAMHNID